MTLEQNIGGGLLRTANQFGGKTAFQLPDRSLSYAELGRFIAGLADVMRRHGVERGSCLAIRADDPRVVVIGIAASSLLGAAWTDGSKEALPLIAEHVTHSLVDRLPPSTTRIPGAIILFDPQELRTVSVTGAEAFPGFEDETQMARIGLSSGTTGRRKAIRLSAALAWRQVARQYAGPDNGGDTVSLALFPAMSGAGIGQRLHTLLSGGTVAEGWAPDLLKAGAINQIKGSPVQFSNFLKDLKQAGIETKLPLALLGGGRPGAEFMVHMRERFQRIAVRYSSTEMGVVGFYPHAEREDYDGRLEPRPDVQIEIVDDENRPVPVGEVGYLRLRADVSMPRYLDSALDAEAFRNGWFYPGDMATLSEEGFLYIEGRSDEATNLGGIKVNLLHYDDLVQAFPGIDDGYSFAKSDEMGIDRLNIIVRFATGANGAETARQLMDAISAAKHLTALPAAVYATGDIPRTETGKAARHAAVHAVERLEPVLITMRGPSVVLH